MKPSIICLTTLLTVAGVASAGDSKALLQKALFAEEVEQNSAKAAALYQRMIDQAASAPKQLAVARFRLAKLHLAAGKHDEALVQLQALAADPAAPADWVAQAKTLLADGRVTIKSNGEMSVDKDTITYLKDTTIDAPRFTLTAAGELKIIYAKQTDLARRKPVPAPIQDDPGIASLWLPAGGSDLKRINATGTVVFKQKPLPGITPFEASGAAATYEPATGQITLSGGSPWIRREGIITRAKQVNQTLTINANTITFSKGGTETIISRPKAEKSASAATPEVYELLKDKLWDWHHGLNLYGEPNGTFQFLSDGKIGVTLHHSEEVRSWRSEGGRRFRVTNANGHYYIFELSKDGREAMALNLPGVVDTTKRLALHQTSATSLEDIDIETLKIILAGQPDTLGDGDILQNLFVRNRHQAIGFLLKNGMSANFREKGGFRRSLLNLACEYGDIDSVKMLLNHHADVNSADSRNQTPLIAAAALGRREIAALLLENGADIHAASTAVYEEWRDPTNTMREVSTALHVACLRGDLPTVRLLFDHGANINAISAKKHATPLIAAMDNMRLEVVKELLARGANPNLPEDGRVNPLRQMTHEGQVEIVRLLLAKGTRYDLQSSVALSQNGLARTTGAALHTAAREGRLAVAEVLVEAGCPVDLAAPQFLETPLHAAAFNGNTVMTKWLLEKGADPKHRLADNSGGQSGWTPLHSAAFRGLPEVAELLMAKGAPPAEPCGDAGLRRTPFQLAVLKGWLPVVKSLLAQPAYQTPEARKQLLAQPDLQGNTALHLAVSREATANAEVVKLLVNSGAPQDAVNQRNQTPRQLSTDPVQGTRDEAVRNALKE